MAYLMEKAERCQMCGTAPWEWDEEQGGSKDAYTPAVHQCMGCYHTKRAQEDEQLMPGASVILVPKRRAHKLKVMAPSD